MLFPICLLRVACRLWFVVCSLVDVVRCVLFLVCCLLFVVVCVVARWLLVDLLLVVCWFLFYGLSVFVVRCVLAVVVRCVMCIVCCCFGCVMFGV